MPNHLGPRPQVNRRITLWPPAPNLTPTGMHSATCLDSEAIATKGRPDTSCRAGGLAHSPDGHEERMVDYGMD